MAEERKGRKGSQRKKKYRKPEFTKHGVLSIIEGD
jgi:hypothetical protein